MTWPKLAPQEAIDPSERSATLVFPRAEIWVKCLPLGVGVIWFQESWPQGQMLFCPSRVGGRMTANRELKMTRLRAWAATEDTVFIWLIGKLVGLGGRGDRSGSRALGVRRAPGTLITPL